MASREIVPERVWEHKDSQVGTWYEVIDPKQPLVEVWADGNGVVIRQETVGHEYADIIELSHGQAYDLLSVISKALEIPVRS